MIVFRVEVNVRPEKVDEARSAFSLLSEESRNVDGVTHFDIAQDLDDPMHFISIETYEDQAALDRQSELPVLKQVMDSLDSLLVEAPIGTKFFVDRAESWTTELSS